MASEQSETRLGVTKVTTDRKRRVSRVDEINLLTDAAMEEMDAAVAEHEKDGFVETGEREIRVTVIQHMKEKSNA